MFSQGAEMFSGRRADVGQDHFAVAGHEVTFLLTEGLGGGLVRARYLG